MARRSAPPPKPKTPILTVGQKQRRIERLRKCITKLEAFDPQKAHKRVPAILELEAAIDKALSSAFGYGTPAYLRYDEAATLDPSPLLANATLRSPGWWTSKTRWEGSGNAPTIFREQGAIDLPAPEAIGTLEEEIADAEPVVTAVQKSKATPVIDAEQESKATQKPEVRTLQPRRWGGIALKAAWRRVGRWLRRRG
jgi:hypothetical protein